MSLLLGCMTRSVWRCYGLGVRAVSMRDAIGSRCCMGLFRRPGQGRLSGALWVGSSFSPVSSPPPLV